MSVLKFPRLYFRGLISWDPGLLNNIADVYDPANVRLLLPEGVKYDTFKDWVLKNNQGSWNYYGTHTCRFAPSSTTITGGALAADAPLVTDDPLIGKPVQLQGKMVDLDPEAVWNTQIFFDDFSLGDEQAGVKAERQRRLHSRWINFRRNLGGLPIAGGAAVVWQTVFPAEQLTWENAAPSPLLTALAQAIRQEQAQGLMVRFCTYRTMYFQNGILNDIQHKPRDVEQLHELYRSGHIFSNPAYSMVVGVIGLWQPGEISSVPEGRYLIPSQPVRPSNAAADVRLGPCVAEVDRARRVLALDFNSTIPEVDGVGLTKANYGALTVAVENGGQITPLATVAAEQYGRAAYEAQAGILNVPLADQSDLLNRLEAGRLLVLVEQNGQTVQALRETELTVHTEERDVYLDQNMPRVITLYVRRQGRPAPAGTQVLVALYDNNFPPRLLPLANQPPEILQVGDEGKAKLWLAPQAPGFLNVGLYPFAASDPIPSPSIQLDIMTDFFLSVRTLPFDDELEAQTPDSALTWNFIYANVLRVYDLLNPVMSSPEVSLPLNDRSIWTQPEFALMLKAATAAEKFESFGYMPVTRSLSAGKRKLTHRWCDLVIQGALPPDKPAPPADEDIAPKEIFSRLA